MIVFRMIEGDLMEHHKEFKFIMQVSPKDKGSVVHWTLVYEKLHENIPDSYSMLEFVAALSRDVDVALRAANWEPYYIYYVATISV